MGLGLFRYPHVQAALEGSSQQHPVGAGLPGQRGQGRRSHSQTDQFKASPCRGFCGHPTTRPHALPLTWQERWPLADNSHLLTVHAPTPKPLSSELQTLSFLSSHLFLLGSHGRKGSPHCPPLPVSHLGSPLPLFLSWKPSPSPRARWELGPSQTAGEWEMVQHFGKEFGSFPSKSNTPCALGPGNFTLLGTDTEK